MQFTPRHFWWCSVWDFVVYCWRPFSFECSRAQRHRARVWFQMLRRLICTKTLSAGLNVRSRAGLGVRLCCAGNANAVYTKTLGGCSVSVLCVLLFETV